MVKSWNIWDFPDNIYILLKKEAHNKFFKEMFKEYGGKRPYARLLGISQMDIKHYWKGYFKKNRKRYVQYIPLWIFKWSCNTDKLKKLIEKGIDKIRVRAGTPLNYNELKLSIKECPELYRIVAHLIGDGFAGKRKVPYYANTCKKLRQQFKKDLQIFGKIKTYERTPSTTPCVMFPKLISDILRHIFNIEFTRPSKLPKEIFSASKKCKSALLQALYDDEGTTSSNITIGMINLNLIKEIKNLVESFNIKTCEIIERKLDVNKYFYYFSIRENDVDKYRKEIGFYHPDKQKRLNIKLKIKERNQKQRTRPLEWSRNKILNLLKIKPRTTIELSNQLLLTFTGIFNHLNYLENTGKIKRTKGKNKIIWKIV